MVDGTFHATYPVETRGEIRAGYSCNVLFRRTAPAFADLCFREELGRSGGEDTVFFATAHQRGARLAYAPQAIVTEAVSPARATLRWLLQRRFRAGQTQVRLGEGHFLLLLKASAKMLLSYLMAVLSLLWLSRAAYWLLRGTFHLGVVCRLLGLREVTPYG
jgi:succinoglycan biosynthesis protein ExoM